ncbi:PAS domain-containing sensor histidine kinase [Halorussus salinus]|uniref:PAS domain-containing sensor histidine kinase n=1 Tax=Halorussus salinus TaxID=1364935 RepID=UPI0010932482|nr:PAS domain-containing sensor histidine kinase [Halorussus salinus]
MTISDAALSAGFDALPGQAAVLNRSGRILATNRAWREFAAAGSGDADHIGVNYLRVCDESDDEQAARTGVAIRSLVEEDRGKVSVEYPCHTPDRERWFTMRALRFAHEGETYVLVHHHEITERKRAELDLRAQNDRLETVAGVLSHDLRNPLNVALGRTELLDAERDTDAGTDADADGESADESDHLAALTRSLERMEAIVENALVLAADEEVTDTRRVELDEQADEAWRQVETGDATLVVAESVAFRADPDLLAHVFENLFRNAVEHGATTVTVGGDEGVGTGDGNQNGSTGESGDETTGVPGFYVADDGPGIPPEARDRVFDANYSTAADGTGLGLAIVRQVVEAHGWSVGVTESAAGDVGVAESAAGGVGGSREVKSDGGPEVRDDGTGIPDEASGANHGARFEISF